MTSRMLSLIGAILIAVAAPQFAMGQGSNGPLGLHHTGMVQPVPRSLERSMSGMLPIARAPDHSGARDLMILGGLAIVGGILSNTYVGAGVALGGLIVGLWGLIRYLE